MSAQRVETLGVPLRTDQSNERRLSWAAGQLLVIDSNIMLRDLRYIARQGLDTSTAIRRLLDIKPCFVAKNVIEEA